VHDPDRLHALDAVRGFALLLGIVLHATMSFLPGFPPGLWAIVDTSPSTALGLVFFVTHIFRMALFFFIAGFFARMSFHRKGNRRFWVDRSKRILLPLIVGWMVLFPAIAAVWIWGLRKTFGDTMPEAPPGASALGAFPLGHLWFLYYLLMLYVVVVLGRHAVVALDRSGRIREAADRIVRASVSGGSAVVLLALPLGLALYFRSDWLVWFGIPTPDQTLIPQWIPLVGYGTAVAFGWLVQRQPELLASWGRQWPGYLAAAMVATGVCLWIGGPRPSFTPVASGLERLASALGYGLALWCWTFAFVGLALRFMSGESRARRYVADSSYWLYLVHLPVVAALQVAVGHQPWHWSVKFPLILAGAFALLFLSYHHLVRYTFIGAVLNGRKLRPARPRPDPKPTGAGRVSLGEPRTADAEPSDSLATLEGVHKRYGKTIALAGLDLEVRRGELLALLGP
jgi:peptidoglycan/LPS O-acetylase OafA/YrhL